MYANFTEETCTGTGDTLTLLGATTGNLPFSLSYADGDLVMGPLEDSGGIIKIAGIGTYNSGPNTITRNDTWNYNGTVVDKNPSTNITLSAGTHTVRCDVIGARLDSTNITINALESFTTSTPDNIGIQDNQNSVTANRLCLVAGVFNSPRLITSFSLDVRIADAAATNTRQGIYSSDINGRPNALLADSGNIDVSTTGDKFTSLATPLFLPAGIYYFGIVSDSAVVQWRGPNSNATAIKQQPIGIANYIAGRYLYLYQDSVTGALPATFAPTNSTNNLPITAGFR
jgi:hypothetical protein